MMDTSDMNAKVDWLWTPAVICPELMQLALEPFISCGFLWWFLTTAQSHQDSLIQTCTQANTSSRSTGTMSRRSTGALTQLLPVSVKHLESMWLLNEPKSSIPTKIWLLVPWHLHPTNIYHYIILPMGNSNWWPQLKVIACGECHSVAAAFDEVTKPGEHGHYVFVVVVFRPYPKKSKGWGWSSHHEFSRVNS